MSDTATTNAPALDELFPLRDVRRRVPYLKDQHPKTPVRWALRGVLVNGERVRLQHARAGRQLLTTEAWLAAFFAAQGLAESSTATVATEPRAQGSARVDPTTVAAKRAATRRRLADAGLGVRRRRGRA